MTVLHMYNCYASTNIVLKSSPFSLLQYAWCSAVKEFMKDLFMAKCLQNYAICTLKHKFLMF